MIAFSLSLPWAVHVADGVLSWPVLAGGFALAGLLALVAGGQVLLRLWQGHDEEIPRLALLTAAFFVASSLHLKLGPTSVHLLLGGLVGVILGWRAPLAILIGVTLQALLIPHGGITTIGVNTCTEAIPAVLAGTLFGLLQRVPWRRCLWFRGGLVFTSSLIWGGALVFAAAVLWTNPLGSALTARGDAGLVLAVHNLEPARDFTLQPVVLLGLVLFALVCAVVESRMENAPEFPLGLLLGGLSVLATVALTGLVLLADGAERWRLFVNLVFLAHLPLAVVEGLVVGCTVSFLARVKPELLGVLPGEQVASTTGGLPTVVSEAVTSSTPAPLSLKPPLVLLALGSTLLFASTAQAHRLKADCEVEPDRHQIQIESYYETDEIPQEATARVYRENGSVLAEGSLDEKGRFVFRYDRAENLRVEVNAPGGHRAELHIPREKLEARPGAPAAPAAEGKPPAEERGGERFRDLAVGVSLVLSVAAFLLSVRNSWQLHRMRSASVTPPSR
jgi:cobalt/nickel transport system permease protein